MTATTFQHTQPQWIPPRSVFDAGQTARVPNKQGDIVVAGEVVQKHISPAMEALYRWVLAHFAGLTAGGLARASSRNHQVGQRRDVHEEGRAADFMARERSAGEPLANWLVAHAEELGVQLVIWYRTEWSSSTIGPKWEDYHGPSEHTDHVHMELSVPAAAMTPAAMVAALDRIVAREGGLGAVGAPPVATGAAGGVAAGGRASGALTVLGVVATASWLGWLLFGKG